MALRPTFSPSSVSSCNADLVLTKVVLVASLSVKITSFTLHSSSSRNNCVSEV